VERKPVKKKSLDLNDQNKKEINESIELERKKKKQKNRKSICQNLIRG